MADNIDLSVATFATASMMPVGDEEVNALWARKMAWNVAGAVGAWATVVLGTSTDVTFGTAKVLLPTRFFNFPSFDFFQLRGGTQVAICPPRYVNLDTPGDFGGFNMVYPVDGSMVLFSYYPDHAAQQRDFAGSRAAFGTFIYRWRGW